MLGSMDLESTVVKAQTSRIPCGPLQAAHSKAWRWRHRSNLVPDGSVGVSDNPGEIEALSVEQQDKVRATIRSHDNDPIAVLSTDLMVRKPEWLDDITEEQIEMIEQQLVMLELERAERIKASRPEDAPAAPQCRGTTYVDEQTGVLRTEAGVPLQTTRTSGAQWFEQFHGADAGPQEMQ